ncbi:MAG: conjugal transfer mating pair stabilization protein TraN [Gammaproteobacteria bacterium]|nr:conjugal transfer mating pair stabilization protein TraN [Gammaproteobacteria bacterium]
MYILKKVLSVFLSWLLILPSTPIYADAFSDQGLDAQQFGSELIDNLSGADTSFNNGQITLPTMDPNTGQFTNTATTTIDVNNLFPGTSSTSTSPMTDFFPATVTPSSGALESVSGVGDDMDDIGKFYQQELFSDANSANPSTTGSAYKVLMDRANQPVADLRNDPVFNVARDVYADIDTISQDFADCTTTTTLTNITNTTRIPDYQDCERMRDFSQSCIVNHFYDASIIEHHSGPYNILPINGQSSINVWIGQVGDNYWTGTCAVYEEVTEYRVTNPAAITSVKLVNAKWDDYMQIWVGPAGQETMVWSGPATTSYWDSNINASVMINDPFPPETLGNCELSTSWNQNPNLDITSAFLNNIDTDDVVRFKIRVSVTGGGEGYAKLQIDYDSDQAVIQDEWLPQNCIDAAKGMYDGFATGTVACTSIPANVEGSCTTIEGIRVCENNLDLSPFPGITNMFSTISPLCNEATVDVDYDYYDGTFCWTNEHGVETCAESGNLSDTCTALESDPQCGFISSQCVEDSRADDGTCYVTEETWDCGVDVPIDDVESTTTYDCVGPIRCMGSDCLNPAEPESASFTETAALLNAAQFMTQDMNCTPVTTNANVTCEVFGGDDFYCKKAVGGIVDCCDVPTQVSLANYVAALMAMGKLDSSLMAIQNGNALVGAYQTMHNAVGNSLTTVTKPFTSYIENISGHVTEFFEPVTVFMDELKQKIKDTVSEIITDMVGDSATTTAGSAVASDGASEIMSNMSSAASTMMAVYAYYQVAMMVIQLVYECEDSEYELAAKRDLKSCNKIGSYCHDDTIFGCLEKRTTYCCYNSPLSRIISDQVRPQVRPYGSVKNPDCGGIDMSEIASIDWSQIDLSEWTAILKLTDVAPDIATMNLETLTGSGSDLNIDGTRLNAGDRAVQRFDGLDIDEIRIDVNNNTVVNPSGQ